MDYRLLHPSNYLGAPDLRGNEVTVIIKSVGQEELTLPGGKKEVRAVMHFEKAKKAWVVNKTNSTLIARLHGKDTDSWIGKSITLYPTETKFGRDTVDCVRVKAKAAV